MNTTNDTITSTSKHNKKATSNPNNDNNAIYQQFWDQLAIPEILPNKDKVQDNHFKLHCYIKDEVAKRPMQFKFIRVNEVACEEGRLFPMFSEYACECHLRRSDINSDSNTSLNVSSHSNLCDEDCLNRVLHIECCDYTHKRVESNCFNGENCGNRAIQQRNYPEVEVFPEFKMGLGLRTLEPIKKGGLVIEYVGEVIDYNEMNRRMLQQRQYAPNDKDFYIMELDSGLYVDGKFKG